MKRFVLMALLIFLLSLGTAACSRQPAVPPEVADDPSPAAESDITGRWEGILTIQGGEFPIRVEFDAADDGITGTLDMSDQGASGMGLSNIRLEADSLHFEMKGGPGVANFDGRLQEDGSIQGDFKQGGITGAFQLERAEAAAVDEPAEEPAAVPEEPLPYTVEEVSFQNGEITLAGELTLPPTGEPYPAVILVSGSGPQDRDGANESVPGYRPSRMLADYLARHGIAALRYDERGVGASTGEQHSATIMDLSTDIEAALAYLQGREEIDPQGIGLLGHSEGSALVAMVAARSPQVAFVISMGGHAVRGYDLMMAQTRRGLEVMGASEEETAEMVQLAQTEYDLIVAQNWDAMEAMTREMLAEQLEAMPAEQREALGEPEEIIAQEVTRMKTWAYSFLTHDPAEDWARVEVPVLALFGELDVLVDLEQNRPPLEAALARGGNDDVTVVAFPQANHLFQQAEVGGPQEWNRLPKEFLPGFLETISGWLVERFPVQP